MNNMVALRYLSIAFQKEAEKKFKKMVETLGITSAQSEILLVLADFGPMSLSEVGDLLLCETRSPSRLVQKMVDLDLIQQNSAPIDKRRIILNLTDSGRKLAEEVKIIEENFLETNRELLGTEDEILRINNFFSDAINDTSSSIKVHTRLNGKNKF